MRSIQTESECSEAATYFKKSSTDVIYREGRPTGCSWHNYGNLELWSVSSGDCDVHGYAGCFCLNPLTFGSTQTTHDGCHRYKTQNHWRANHTIPDHELVIVVRLFLYLSTQNIVFKKAKENFDLTLAIVTVVNRFH